MENKSIGQEKVLLDSKSVYEAIEAVTKLSGALETLCKKHKVAPCGIKEKARQLARAARTLGRTEGLRKKAELKQREKLREQNVMARETLVLHEAQEGQTGTGNAGVTKKKASSAIDAIRLLKKERLQEIEEAKIEAELKAKIAAVKIKEER